MVNTGYSNVDVSISMYKQPEIRMEEEDIYTDKKMANNITAEKWKVPKTRPNTNRITKNRNGKMTHIFQNVQTVKGFQKRGKQRTLH